ncbi:DegQ family serine endoprotease [Oceanicoccus sp. KOV_DT_Chl]|uniref:DegQ family serine endoprotease n=1 Tax=Oceanicoccus sp. KOV_DT_Chl TaxID=1904639 RepID=UPI001F294265|nr:DegQ family serine endoprotease [Oceanicoccus sp. KOV_DT_Chl]
MRSMFGPAFGFLFLMMLVPNLSWSMLPALDSQGQPLPSLAPLVEEVAPSVVNISTYTTQTLQQNPLLRDPFFRRFFNVPPGQQVPHTRKTQSAGSGVITDAKNGTVVTNHHVINGADEIHVGLQDGRSYQAELIGSDPDVDIAVLKLKEFGELKALPMAKPDKLRVGDFVIAIGNPFGLGQSVTSGVVSALGRSGLGIEGYENFIQTDASINPGNSGGALVNLRGELVGINTAIIAPAGGNIGIGFAIPADMAKSSIDQIVEHGEVRRGQLGIIIQDLTRDLAEAFAIDKQQQGVLIAEVQLNSAADKAGLRAGDVVISVDGDVVENSAQLRNEIGQRRIGEKVSLTILREGRSKTVKATVAEAVSKQISSATIHPALEGASLQVSKQGGIEVTALAEGSRAASSGLRAGDVILSVNRYAVNSVDDLRELAARYKQRLVLRIKRGNAAFYLVLQ